MIHPAFARMTWAPCHRCGEPIDPANLLRIRPPCPGVEPEPWLRAVARNAWDQAAPAHQVGRGHVTVHRDGCCARAALKPLVSVHPGGPSGCVASAKATARADYAAALARVTEQLAARGVVTAPRIHGAVTTTAAAENNFGRIVWSDYFGSRLVVVRYQDDEHWSFVVESRPSEVLRARARLSEMARAAVTTMAEPLPTADLGPHRGAGWMVEADRG